jgi:hypothetical protein
MPNNEQWKCTSCGGFTMTPPRSMAHWWLTLLSGIALGLYIAFIIARHS